MNCSILVPPLTTMPVASDQDHHDLQHSGPTINDNVSSL